MLIGIPAILGPQLLFNLCAMGHGDEIAIVDGNYPADAHSAGKGGLIRADGHGIADILDAILCVLPIDDDEAAIFHATVGGDGKTLAPVHTQIRRICARRHPGRAVAALTAADFYPRVGRAHTIVATSELRLYANVILRKGVIAPVE